MSDDPKGTQGGRGLWARLWAAPRSKWLFGIPVGALLAVLVGMALYAGGGVALSATSSHAFCASACHEMNSFVTPGWQVSTHGRNASGVPAGCPDCHVPGPAGAKMMRKVAAVREGYHTVLGTIDTQPEFDAHKLEMAQRVWEYMKATDSRECRACHDKARMDSEAQSKPARRAHEKAAQSGKTCIDCHKGVAHTLPEGFEE